MGYYLAQISISLTCNSDSESVKKIDKILSQIRETKTNNPYINSFKKAVISPDGKSRKLESIDNSIIKNLNIKK